MMFLLAILAIAAGVAFYAVALYNGLVALRNGSDAAWSDIDVQLKRRHDLIPNLVETVKGYAAHEQGTLDRVIQARNAAQAAGGVHDKAVTEGTLSGALRGLFALAEAYPDLKANQNFLQLQGNLNEIEDHLQNARRYYNAVVRDLNTKCEAFPSNLVAQRFGFAKREYFELDDAAERAVPRISFGG